MTLQRQLVITIIALFTLMFFGTFGISSYFSHRYLDQQLRTHARDAATSLGVLLSPQMQKNDLAGMTSTVDAIFDRGYYLTIKLMNNADQLIIDRDTVLKIDNVPGWFVRLIQFKVPEEQALLMAGWRQEGKIIVRSHPGYAYQELWDQSRSVLVWYALMALIIIFMGFITIRHLLKPIKRIADQADAITKGQFPIQKELPKTLQLRQVTLAMNRMTTKLERQFEDQRKETSQLRQQAYQDPLTRLPNEAYFKNHVSHELEEKQFNRDAAMLLIDLSGLKLFNQRYGHDAGDRLLQRCSALIGEAIVKMPNVLLARMSGARFAVFMSLYSTADIQATAKRIFENLVTLSDTVRQDQSHIGIHIGVEIIKSAMKVNEVLLGAEQVLSSAQTSMVDRFEIGEFTATAIAPEVQWREIIMQLIEKQNFDFEFSPAHDLTTNRLIYAECLFTARDSHGLPYARKALFAMAERLGLAYQLDQIILKKLMASLSKQVLRHDYVLNLSIESLRQTDVVQWLSSVLEQNLKVAKHIVFEVSEVSAVHNLDAVRGILAAIGPLGANLSIDHFGKASSAFAYLQGTRILFVKLDGAYTRGIHLNESNQFYVQSLVRLAHSLDIPVTAERVEHASELAMLRSFEVDAAQGSGLLP